MNAPPYLKELQSLFSSFPWISKVCMSHGMQIIMAVWINEDSDCVYLRWYPGEELFYLNPEEKSIMVEQGISINDLQYLKVLVEDCIFRGADKSYFDVIQYDKGFEIFLKPRTQGCEL